MQNHTQSISAETARKQAHAELQLLLAMTVAAEAREREVLAEEVYAKAKTPANFRAWKVFEFALRRAERDEELCRLQVAATS